MTQCESSVQVVGQLVPTPAQVYGVQEGTPGFPAASTVHVPSALAPSEALHALHPPAQAESQQTPSEQYPELHCVPVVHGAPLASPPDRHVPAEQTPVEHWELLVHAAPGFSFWTHWCPVVQ